MVKKRWNQAILAVLLLATLVLSTVSILLLCGAAKRADAQTKAYQAAKQQLDADVLEMKQALTVLTFKECTNVSASSPIEDVEADTRSNAFSLRESNGKIGVYTEAGYLIRLLNVDVSTLPKTDRDRLAVGISVSSWKELIALIEDYEE